MSRALKDLVVACLLTFVGLTIGLLLADVAHAKSAGRQPNGVCAAAPAGGHEHPPGCGAHPDAR